MALFLIAACLPAVAQTVTWDNDGGTGDGLWSTNTNWDGDAVPVGGDNVIINNGDAVTGIQFNTTYNITLSGGSSITDPVGGVWRAGGATITVNSGSTLGSGGFWDLQNATISFKDGSAVNMSNWEQKGTNVFNFELSASGFTALTPAALNFGGGATIADATYRVEMAAYTGTSSAVITLVDFGVDGSGLTDGIFQGAGGLEILNPPAGSTTTLRWNDATDSIEVVIDYPNVWTGGDGNWKVDGNWSEGTQPGAGDNAVIEAGDTVTYDSGGNLPSGINLQLDGTLTNSGQGAIRLNGANITVGSTGEIAGDFWDLDEAKITFIDGAKYSANDWENKDGNEFTFVLGESGFTTLTPNRFFVGSGNVHNPGDISNDSYTADMSAYTGGTGVITLVDYTTDFASMDNTKFQTADLEVIAPAGYVANLQWNDTEESIELNITSAPVTELPNITGITLDGSGDVIITLDGPAAGLTAQQSDDLTGFADVASTPSGNTLTIDSADVDPNDDGKDFYRVRN